VLLARWLLFRNLHHRTSCSRGDRHLHAAVALPNERGVCECPASGVFDLRSRLHGLPHRYQWANEFVIEHYNASGGRARLYSTKTANQVVTDTREEEVFGVQANYYALPLPPGVLVGADIAGTNIKWGNQCPCPEADILGLGPVSGFYGLGIELGGLDGWYSIRFNRLLPADWDYLPFRIQLDDGLHYGYMRLAHERALNGNSARVYAVLRGWAWETEPGVPITIVPEPQTATAVGLVGALAAWRRRRSEVGPVGRRLFQSC
jgi:hypothetical protein